MEVFRLLLVVSLLYAAEGVCYFPVELQGIFSTQSSLADGSTHQYSQITILPDGIPVWGVCHYKSAGNVILHDGTGGQDCFRCFQIIQRSPNVVQVYTEGLDKCYTNEGAALASCPSNEDIKIQKAREIMLYKSRTFTRSGAIDQVFCPFSGQYSFTYNVNDGTENQVECSGSSSSLSNCPDASKLQLKFNGCKFGDSELNFQCLGSWTGLDDYKYMALWDTSGGPATKPQYRCAMYHVEEGTGRIFIGFSVDATCINQLISPWDGYEAMVLTPKKLPPKPAPVHSHSCVFPKWAHGKWQDMEIADRSLWWRDANKDKTYRTLCLSQDEPHGEKFAVYSQNQCGEEEFTCVWIKKRDTNVLEFKMATVQYSYFNSDRICSDDLFIGEQWKTQGRITNSERPGCPVLGQYSGVIPDATELCAHMSSDCTNPQLMHYTVTTCVNATDKYEDRRYQCLGQWEEEGMMYTFTYRQDVDTYECFAGVVDNDVDAYIIEAGLNCKRGLKPIEKGMQVHQEASCSNAWENTRIITAKPELYPSRKVTLPPWWPSTSRRPWLKKSTSTTPKPPWKNQKPIEVYSVSSINSSNLALCILCLSFYLLR